MGIGLHNRSFVTAKPSLKSVLWYSLFAASALLPWTIILLSSARGFDLTDESFYLLSYARPEDITTSFTLFGVVGKLIFELGGGTIAGLRALGAFIWLTGSVVATWVTIGFLSRRSSLQRSALADARTRFMLASVPVAGGALYYSNWLLTPGYNWFALVGLTLFWIGFLFWLEPGLPRWATNVGASLLAFAAALVFWSKATSAGLLLFYPAGALVLYRSHWRRLLNPQTIACGIIGIGLGMCLPLLYGLSPDSIITTLKHGYQYRLLDTSGRYGGPLALLSIAVRRSGSLLIHNTFPLRFAWIWLPSILGALLVVLRSKAQPEHRQRSLRVAQLLLILGCMASLSVVTILTPPEVIGSWILNVTLLIVSYLVAGNFVYRKLAADRVRTHRLRASAWAIPVFGLILVFTFGSANTYTFQAGMAAYFALLGVSVLFLPYDRKHLNSALGRAAVVLLLAAIVWLTYRGSLTPYRQDVPAWEMDRRVSLGDSGANLIVSEEMSQYISTLQGLAAGGFQPGTPIIDLTGHTPGAAYALGGRAYGFPWLIGGRSHSEVGAIFILSQWRQSDLDMAWILTVEENGVRSIPISVLEEVGLDFSTAYEKVGTVRRPASQELQALWRPSDGS